MVASRSEQLCHAGEDPVGSRGTATRSSPQTSDIIPRSRFSGPSILEADCTQQREEPSVATKSASKHWCMILQLLSLP